MVEAIYHAIANRQWVMHERPVAEIKSDKSLYSWPQVSEKAVKEPV